MSNKNSQHESCKVGLCYQITVSANGQESTIDLIAVEDPEHQFIHAWNAILSFFDINKIDLKSDITVTITSKQKPEAAKLLENRIRTTLGIYLLSNTNTGGANKLQKLTVKELRQKATSLAIPGRSKLTTKAALVAAIQRNGKKKNKK